MKRKIALLIMVLAAYSSIYAQDTLSYLTSSCMVLTKSASTDSCSEGINFKYFNDSIEIYGTITANCCGVHLVIVNKASDSIYLTTHDTGELCKCICKYCFDIKTSAKNSDTIVSLDGITYNTKSYLSIVQSTEANDNLIELYPNPMQKRCMLKVNSAIKLSEIILSDITGRTVGKLKSSSTYIDMNNLPSGTYLISFNFTDRQKITKKVILR